jgi:hypothetical protein
MSAQRRFDGDDGEEEEEEEEEVEEEGDPRWIMQVVALFDYEPEGEGMEMIS